MNSSYSQEYSKFAMFPSQVNEQLDHATGGIDDPLLLYRWKVAHSGLQGWNSLHTTGPTVAAN
jgi:hypothetical protein